MNTLLFPGQGSQVVGMGSEFVDNFDLVKQIFKEADEKLGFKISKIILEGPDTDLKLTKNTQPARAKCGPCSTSSGSVPSRPISCRMWS